MNICSVEGCDREVNSSGVCSMHYKRYLRRTGESEKAIKSLFNFKKCNAAGCIENGARMGFCQMHLKEFNFE